MTNVDSTISWTTAVKAWWSLTWRYMISNVAMGCVVIVTLLVLRSTNSGVVPASLDEFLNQAVDSFEKIIGSSWDKLAMSVGIVAILSMAILVWAMRRTLEIYLVNGSGRISFTRALGASGSFLWRATIVHVLSVLALLMGRIGLVALLFKGSLIVWAFAIFNLMASIWFLFGPHLWAMRQTLRLQARRV